MAGRRSTSDLERSPEHRALQPHVVASRLSSAQEDARPFEHRGNHAGRVGRGPARHGRFGRALLFFVIFSGLAAPASALVILSEIFYDLRICSSGHGAYKLGFGVVPDSSCYGAGEARARLAKSSIEFQNATLISAPGITV